jgi:hypothetical protein
MTRNFENRLNLLEQQAEDAENLIMPWDEWHRFKRLPHDEQRAYIDAKLEALFDEARKQMETAKGTTN